MGNQMEIAKADKALQKEENAHRITVEIKNIYGENLAYPKCSKAAAFAAIAGTATLTPRVLRLIKNLGYEIIQLSATLEI